MGRRSVTGGVIESRGKIRLRFTFQGRELRPTLDLRWNEVNRRAALRLVDEIRERIRRGTFVLSEYFPEFGRATALQAELQVPARTFGDYAELYQKSLTKKAAATREDYRKILNLAWLPQLRDRVIAEIRYSELEDLISELSVAGKTLNNYLIPLRGVFAYALKDHAIASNPAAGIENVPVQHPVPDPFEQAEVELILDDLAAREGPQVMNYFAAAFFAGFRPSEQIALVWSDVDFVRRNVRVQRGVVRGKAKDSTKTYRVRDVELSDRAWAAIDDQRAHTQLAGREIFWNPATEAPWADIQTQWRIWRRCLKRVGLRYREPYQTRHTFATLALMAGANPTWIARQMGHANAQMLFRVYAKWIDGADKSREREKLNIGFRHDSATKSAALFGNPSGINILTWRRERDSNPRYTFLGVCSLSRGVPSTTRPSLRSHRFYLSAIHARQSKIAHKSSSVHAACGA